LGFNGASTELNSSFIILALHHFLSFNLKFDLIYDNIKPPLAAVGDYTMWMFI